MSREELFERHFTGALSADEARELKRLLSEDEEARRDFVRFTQERSILVQLTGRLAEQAVAERRKPAPRRSAGGKPWIFGLVAAAAFIGVVAVVSSFSSDPPPMPAPPRARREETRRAEAQVADRQAEERAAREAMAKVEEEARKVREPLQQPLDEALRAEELRKAAEEKVRIEARRREAEAVVERAAAERRKAEEELARKREAEKPAPAPGPTLTAAATLQAVEGEVRVEGRPAREGAGILPGQALECAGASSRAVLRFDDGSRLELAGDTAVRDVRERDAKTGKGVFVAKGAVSAVIARQPAGRPMVVTTPHGEARVLGTTLRVLVSTAAGTRVEVREGRVRVVRSADGRGADVSSGQYAVAAPGPAPVARPLFTPRIEEAFEAMPAWTSAWSAPWGAPGAWSIGPGQGGSALLGSRPAKGSSAQVLVYPVPANTRIEVSIAMKCPKLPADGWAEFGFRLGSQTAEDFDTNPGGWTLVKRFDAKGQNGNGSVWTVYSAQAETGASTQVTVGFKLGAQAGAAPAVGWDSLRISY